MVKPGYKQTRIGVIPEDWSVEPLGDLGEALIGLTYKPSDVRERGTLVLRSSNIQHDALAFDDNVFVDTDIPERIKVRPGDVLVCVRNGSRSLIGKAALLDERTVGMTFGAFMAVYRSPIGKLANYLFQSEILKRQINEHLGATINQITNKSLNSFCIPVSPRDDERQAIAGALSDADALSELLEKLIAKKRQIKQGAMQALLTGNTRLPGFSGEWERNLLGSIGSTYGGLTGKTKVDFGIGDARYVPFLNILENVVVDPALLDAVRILPGESQNCIRKGDLLFNGTSETPDELAMGAVVRASIPNLYLNSFCFGFRTSNVDDHSALFLAYLFRSLVGRRLMRQLAQGATRYNMSKRQFLELEIDMPEYREQVAISSVLSDMDAEIAALKTKLAKARQIKGGMMQELLTGRIRLINGELRMENGE